MEMHWHWMIVIYLFLGGLGAGAYLTSFAAERGWLGANSNLQRAGYYLAAPIVAIGTVLLVFDLGQGLSKPWLLVRLLFNLNSVMTWGVYILALFIVVGLIKGFCVFRKISAPKILSWAGAILALATGTYTGMLLAVIGAVPLWNTWLMPVLFVLSALSTGLSLTSLIAARVEKGKTGHRKEGFFHIVLMVLELIVVVVFITLMATGGNGSVGQDSAEFLISGVYALAFWGYFIALGLVFPLVVFLIQHRRTAKQTTEAIHHTYLVKVTDIAVLVGGFTLRALIIFAALPIWDGVTIP
ncbi:polysulfide reductase NrfD [Dehalobacter sp. DCM]|uniref:NrfD/PsrC family molybdoenzyme membrane anchor subunit n=1 Tax=Dehalobacter sp. DCM TaxID=2907827 RepID=UPI00308212EE|nr:polysulfide reductase NrfD [Dehalobacter sp. DCM]